MFILVACGGDKDSVKESNESSNGNNTQKEEFDKDEKNQIDDSIKEDTTQNDSIEENTINPLSIQIDGKVYNFTEKSYLDGYENIGGYAISTRLGETFKYFISGNGDNKEAIDKSDINVLVKCDNLLTDFKHNGISVEGSSPDTKVFLDHDFSLVASSLNLGDYNIAVYGNTFVNSFDYLGFNAHSDETPLIENGFFASFAENEYYNIYSPGNFDWKDIEKKYEEVYALDLSTADIQRNIENAFELSKEYFMSFSLELTDFMNFDRGFGPRADEIFSHGAKASRVNWIKEPFKQDRTYKLAISDQLRKLKNGEIPYFILVAGSVNPKVVEDFGSNTLSVYMFTNKENILSWPGVWTK